MRGVRQAENDVVLLDWIWIECRCTLLCPCFAFVALVVNSRMTRTHSHLVQVRGQRGREKVAAASSGGGWIDG